MSGVGYTCARSWRVGGREYRQCPRRAAGVTQDVEKKEGAEIWPGAWLKWLLRLLNEDENQNPKDNKRQQQKHPQPQRGVGP